MDNLIVKEELSKVSIGEKESSTVKTPLVDALRSYFKGQIVETEMGLGVE